MSKTNDDDFESIDNSRFTLLIVDDQPFNLELLAQLLEELGFELMFATDGLSCLEKADTYVPDLILLDIQMPGIDGFETCRRLKANEKTHDIPILFLSALSETQEKVQGFAVGGVDYVTKPIQFDELVARIRSQLRILHLANHLREANETLERRVVERTEQLKKSNRDIIFALAHSLQLRDHESSDHCERVMYWTVTFARHLGIDPAQMTTIARGALLHDIGKIGIPDGILLKNGALSVEEWAVMKTHPTHAYTILQSIPSLVDAIEIPWCHHENWNGSGYPRGLQSDAIPPSVRIFSIVDFWDAISTDRPYRNAMAPHEIELNLLKERGTKFQAQLVDSLLPLMRAVDFNPRSYSPEALNRVLDFL